MPGAARLGDSCAGHGCFPATPIIEGSGDVIINGKPAARKSDAVLLHACPCPNVPHGVHNRAISAGSGTVIINGKLAARIGDAIGCGGSVAAGSGNVIIGDSPYQSPVKPCAEQSAKSRAPLLALTPMLLPTLMEWASVAELPILDDLLSVAQRKDRYLARAKLATEAATLPGLADAAKRLAFNNDSILRAEAAQYVYSVDEFRRGVQDKLPKAPVGLDILDTGAIPGLKNANMTDMKTGFGSALFKSAINGETMLTYRGTNNAVTGAKDWLTNAAQGMGLESAQYNQAMDLAKLVKRAVSPPPVIVGHSLGGGLASAGVGVTGLPGYTFNAAGLHTNTVARVGGADLAKTASLIKTQAVDGEVLTMAQTYGKALIPGLLSGAGALIGGTAGAVLGGVIGVAKLLGGGLPKASGDMMALPAVGGSPIARHGMDQVIAGIESQKKEDIGKITNTFRGI
ncbi:PAAR domain-containing protein [Pectobacterium brasiliense]|uniref:PAAR domain-containing protein n=1 Tax=Pectobacterium brasiliense TaxID=180957 RepID=UPI0015E05437|nr:PAAR domain-containing protein [Pectobacterium brasiliense]MBA0198860.1 PAAR domain-containing protein [Pectobacterium brasiliense]MBN3096125.1 PAAR domain-containing protein [Pectobacterium brasiliense]MBN3142339.1 PAAR domain-containing protein [Pectobacterium brasiliense]MBW5898361.1 PAAR domain-containing protein [Pectobacterium brasiliense]